MNRARAAFQKELRTKLSSHHWRQRFAVRESTCNASRIRRTRPGFRPCIIIVINTTTRPMGMEEEIEPYIAEMIADLECLIAILKSEIVSRQNDGGT